MTFLWKFEADIRSTGARFHLDEDIPFFGNYQQAQAQAHERKARWEQQHHHQLIDHVELLFSITPYKQQIPASLLKLAGYALANVIQLSRADEKMSHNIIMLEKDGRRKADTIQSDCGKEAAEIVQSYLKDATQKKLYDKCVMAYNGTLIHGATTEDAFICRMYTGDLSGNSFVYQVYQPSSKTSALSFVGMPGLNLDNGAIGGRAVWFEILTEGCLQHAEENNEWDHINHMRHLINYAETIHSGRTQKKRLNPDPLMTEQVVNLINKDKTDTTRLYALMDSTSEDNALLNILNDPHIQKAPLLTGSLKYQFNIVSPYLICLDHQVANVKDLIARTWGKLLGIFLTSDADMDTLLAHLIENLHFKADDGHDVLFRFYDPVVMGDYQSLLASKEAVGFFGPVKRFIFETENGEPVELEKPEGTHGAPYKREALFKLLRDYEKNANGG